MDFIVIIFSLKQDKSIMQYTDLVSFNAYTCTQMFTSVGKPHVLDHPYFFFSPLETTSRKNVKVVIQYTEINRFSVMHLLSCTDSSVE